MEIILVLNEIKDIIICPFCGMPTEIVWVHGHGQCLFCKMMLDECCSGEYNQKDIEEQKKIIQKENTDQHDKNN